MHIADAQREMRSAFLGGLVGQLVSGLLWLTSAALWTWGSPRAGITFVVVGGFFIFPLTQAGLRLMGRPGRVAPENGLYSLGSQVALVLPLCLPVVGAAALHRLDWFYPALMVALGAHYLPFVFLYGMRMFGALAVILWAGGVFLGTWFPLGATAGAWFTGAVLLAFAFLGRALVLGEERRGG
ncbi:MAG TPA: hypothetical protein VLA43_01035 [Longimicrobiales bacterium]|nr:hypothetical protein [Longimicrobiales bacterium]